MLCKTCLSQVTKNMSKEGASVLRIIAKSKGITQADILKSEDAEKYNLTYAKLNRSLIELEAKLLIDYQEEGRSKLYKLTKNGVNLFKYSKKN